MQALSTVAVRRSTMKDSKSHCKSENLLCQNANPDDSVNSVEGPHLFGWMLTIYTRRRYRQYQYL